MIRKDLNTIICWVVLVCTLLASCTPFSGKSPAETALAGSPTPVNLYSSAANTEAVNAVAQKYLDAWKREDYGTMYSLLTTLSQDAIHAEEFNKQYQSIAVEAALSSVDYEILSVMVNPDTAQVRYRVKLDSVLVGLITRDTVMNLRLENGQWRVAWDDTLILPELEGGNYLVMNRSGYIPARANIYDRQGLALVAQADATAIGLLPDQVDPANSGSLFAKLSELTGVSVDNIQSLYESAPPGAGWYVPLGEVSAEVISSQFSALVQSEGHHDEAL